MSYIQEYIDLITKATTITLLSKSKTGGRGKGVIVYNELGEIAEINISSSLITQFYKKGNKRDICPQKMYVTVITKKFTQPPTLNMQKGLYLESLLLGETANGTPLTDLPRDKRTGKKLADQLNIEKQASLWEQKKEHHGIIVNSSGEFKNVQVRHKVLWENIDHPDITLNVWTTADIISPFKDTGIDYKMAVLDVKGCGNVNNTFGDYSWGEPKYLDHFQLVLYSIVYDIDAVAYLVFDWSKNLGFKPIPVNVNVNHTDPIMANEAKNRINECKETIRKFVNDIILYEKHGWVKEPGTECTSCPNIYCEHYGKVQEI